MPLPTSGHTGISVTKNISLHCYHCTPKSVLGVQISRKDQENRICLFHALFFSKNRKKNILKTYKNQNPLKIDYLEGSFYSLFNFTEKQLTKPLKMNIRNSAVPRKK